MEGKIQILNDNEKIDEYRVVLKFNEKKNYYYYRIDLYKYENVDNIRFISNQEGNIFFSLKVDFYERFIVQSSKYLNRVLIEANLEKKPKHKRHVFYIRKIIK